MKNYLLNYRISKINLVAKKLAKVYSKKESIDQSNVHNGQYAFEFDGVSKSFQNGKIKANQNINLKVKWNEIHAIVGENGAGKTTMMSMLFGLFKPDSGEIKVNGKSVNFKSAIDAANAGIGMVHQHFKLVEVYSLLDNIILGAEPTNKLGIINKKQARNKIEKLANKYNLKVDLNTKVNNASVGEQQRTEILKLLYRDSEILIFDEPTAVLSDDEIKGFLNMLLEFKKQGKTIVIITHKLNEVKAIADRVSVIRKGEYIGTYDVAKSSIEDISRYMIGTKFNETKNNRIINYNADRKNLLSVKNLTLSKISQPKILATKDLNFDVKQGEILAIAGIEGNGQSEIALAIGGITKPKHGEILFYSKENKKPIVINKCTVKNIYDFGISHVPEDRLKYGLIKNESIAYNVVSSIIDRKPFSHHGIINNNAINNYARLVCNEWDVRGSQNINSPVSNLSGGNQQKLVIGREMNKFHKLSVLVQPTRGLDLKAISDIHKKLIQDVKKGNSILLISYELDEIFKIADRILVIDNGKIVHETLTRDSNKEKIGQFLSRSAMKGGC